MQLNIIMNYVTLCPSQVSSFKYKILPFLQNKSQSDQESGTQWNRVKIDIYIYIYICILSESQVSAYFLNCIRYENMLSEQRDRMFPYLKSWFYG